MRFAFIIARKTRRTMVYHFVNMVFLGISIEGIAC